MMIVNKRREEAKTKEEQKQAQDTVNKKGKKKVKQLNQTSRQDSRSTSQKTPAIPDKPPKVASAPVIPQQHTAVPTAAAVGDNTEPPPPGYPGTRTPKRALDDPIQPTPKRPKGADEPMHPPVLSVPEGPPTRKVAVGQESRTAFVSNLNYATSIEVVTAIFSDCGAIKEARLVKDFKGRSKGFGFVVFETNESLMKAIKKDRTPIGNRPMFVSEYEPDKQGHSFKYSTGKEKDKLFVRGLPYSMSEQEVKEAFEAHAPVSEIRLVTHRNGYSKGTCFIKFADADAAERVRAAMDQTEQRGFTITVLISDPSAPKRPATQGTGSNAVNKGDADSPEERNFDPVGGKFRTTSDEVGARKPKLAFVPRILAKPALGAPKKTPLQDEVNGGSVPKPKSNEDFRKMLMK